MSEDDDSERFNGRGHPAGYEPYDDEPGSGSLAVLEMLYEGGFQVAGSHDNPPYRKVDPAVFVFSHPDHEGGFMVTIPVGELHGKALRAVRNRDGSWSAVEDVGLFSELPDWVTHHPPEESGNADKLDGGDVLPCPVCGGDIIHPGECDPEEREDGD